MAQLGDGLQQLLKNLGEQGAQAARSRRVAEVHVRWRTAVEAVYGASTSLILDHTNAVYIMRPDQANDPLAARVPQGKTLLVVYSDDAMVRSDLDARQEMLKMHLNRQGEHVELFSIKPARFDMKARHPFREEIARLAQDAAAPTPEPLIDHEAAERLRAQASLVENKRLRESILNALDASEQPPTSKNGKSAL